jgi:hypothetical protein
MPIRTARHGFAAIATLISAASLALAQPPVPAASPARDDGNPAAYAKSLAEFAESPIAAILEAAGPDAREFHDHVTTLANPYFEGRVPGVRGNTLAADYIEWYFKRAGLAPAFATETRAADGSTVLDPRTGYRQEFQAGTNLKVVAQSARFEPLDRGLVWNSDLKPGRDFNVLGSSGNGKAVGPPVFVGYSIADAEDHGYTSFQGATDLSGKIAIVLRFEPIDEHGKSRWSKGGWSPESDLQAKLKAAAERGAAGIILVNPPGADDPRARELSDAQSTRAPALKVPVVMMTTEAVDWLLQAAARGRPHQTLEDLRKAADEKGVVVDIPRAQVTLETALEREAVTTSNVGAVLEGKGALKDQYIILGAHYDHVGYGPIGVETTNLGKLHPGADDNASGASALLVLAGKLARSYDALPAGADARSVLFLGFSAEESGLTGSRHFVSHPTITHEQMSLMINMDMVGRLRTDPPLDLEGTESAVGFYDWLAPSLERSGLRITHGANITQNSDHYSFYTRKVPVLVLFTGYHRDYHKPGDTASKINHLGAARIISLVHDVALAAAQRPEPFVFAPSKKKKEDQASLCARRSDSASPRGTTAMMTACWWAMSARGGPRPTPASRPATA